MARARSPVGAVLLVALFVLVGPARGDEPPTSPEVKRHVSLGVSHYDAGRYEDAVREFDLAYRLSHKPALLFNIARAEAKLGHDETAIAFLRKYLEEAPDAPDAAAVQAEIEAREKALTIQGQEKKAEAEVAEAKRAAEAARAQAAKQAQEAQQAQQARAEETHKLEAENDRGRKARALKAPGIGLLVGGVVVAVVGIGLGAGAVSAANDVSNQHTVEWADCCRASESRGRALAATGIAFDVVGGVAAVVGIVMTAIGVKAGRAPAAEEASLRFSPGRFTVGGAF